MKRALPRHFYPLLFLVLLAANIPIYRTIFAPHVVTVSVLEVGKGSATLVRSPHGKTLLIDTGPDASILRALGNTLPEWQRLIDAVILTSAKAQFAGGLPTVESRYILTTRMSIGDALIPYGSSLAFDTDVSITVLSPGTFSISYGSTSFAISSSTPPGTYTSDGTSIQK